MNKLWNILLKKQEIKYPRIALFAITASIVLLGVLLGSNIMEIGKSKASDKQTTFKYYTSIKVEQGDTLWSIAKEHMGTEYASIQHYIDEVKQLNKLRVDDIHSGQYLMIPYYSSEFY